jgi:hypothetical protein
MPNISMLGAAYGQDHIVTDRRWTPTDVADVVTPAEFAASQDIRTIDAYLAATNAAYWTATRLNQESLNDKIFWLRNQVPNQAGLA